MKMIQMKKSVLKLFMAAAVLTYACDDSETNEILSTSNLTETDELGLAAENTSEYVFEDVNAITDVLSMRSSTSTFNSASKKGVLDCAEVTEDTEANTITIDYGTEGCTDTRGRIRSGKVIISYSEESKVEGSYKSITFENYYLDDTRIEGVRTRTITSIDSTTSTIEMEMTLTGGKLTFSDGSFSTRESQKTRVWNYSTGEVSVAGSSSGTDQDGISSNMEITEPLIFKKDCSIARMRVPLAGVKVLTVGDEETMSINYGDGNCDLLAVVTKDGIEEEIELKARGKGRGRKGYKGRGN